MLIEPHEVRTIVEVGAGERQPVTACPAEYRERSGEDRTRRGKRVAGWVQRAGALDGCGASTVRVAILIQGCRVNQRGCRNGISTSQEIRTIPVITPPTRWHPATYRFFCKQPTRHE